MADHMLKSRTHTSKKSLKITNKNSQLYVNTQQHTEYHKTHTEASSKFTMQSNVK